MGRAGISNWTGEQDRWRRLLGRTVLPAAVIDMGALEANLASLVSIASAQSTGMKPTLRLATKSLRVPAVVRRVQELTSRARGLMTYSASETLAWSELGFDDLLCAYPAARREDAAVFGALADTGTVAVAMVDSAEHIDLLAATRSSKSPPIPVCIDVDASLSMGPLHIGVRRSPLRSIDQIVSLADHVARRPGVRLHGIMCYEAQVAGLPDHTPGATLLDPAKRLIKEASRRHVRRLRQRVVNALSDAGHNLELVNGGGSGSIASTASEECVSEVTIGSGLYATRLFDHYDGLDWNPALFFALAVVRRPAPGIVTCAGGGYIASGPPGEDRTPSVFSPSGLTTLDMEGWGEVQTPFRVPPGVHLAIGEPVICRFAKAGESLSRFGSVVLTREGEIESVVKTIRGHFPDVV